MASSMWDLWQLAIARVQGESRGVDVPPWLIHARVSELDPSRLAVMLPEAPRGTEVEASLRAALERALAQHMGRRVSLEFQTLPTELVGPAVATAPHGQFLLEDRPRLNPQYTFENFITGPCNRMAHAAALAVGDLPGRAYNPLFIHASVGLGKTHLIQALCHKINQNRPDVAMMYMSCEDFVNRFITAIERGQIEEFRYRFRYLDVLVIDDIHFLADKERTQEEFFHTFNTLYQAQKQVVLSSDSPPQEIPRLEERLVSRFKWGLVVRIDRPSYETRVAIVQTKARLRGRELPEEVVKYIATVIDTNNRELEGAVVRVLGYASLCNRHIDVDLAKEALRDLVGAHPKNITIQTIADAVLVRYNSRLADLQSKRRAQSVTMPRQICMYIARRLTGQSLQEIGAFFGGRDHTTVLHAQRKVKQMVAHDPTFRGLVEAIERDILRT
jgi:chromosomal replication initiator protein